MAARMISGAGVTPVGVKLPLATMVCDEAVDVADPIDGVSVSPMPPLMGGRPAAMDMGV
jgi:hypothetical protein